MYVGILFSFALILIIFAGVSRNTDTEQRKGLQADVAALSEKNTVLQAENKKLFQTIDELTAASDAQGAKTEAFNMVEAKLKEAYDLYIAKRITDARTLIAEIDETTLTTSQKIVYNIIKKGR